MLYSQREHTNTGVSSPRDAGSYRLPSIQAARLCKRGDSVVLNAWSPDNQDYELMFLVCHEPTDFPMVLEPGIQVYNEDHIQ